MEKSWDSGSLGWSYRQPNCAHTTRPSLVMQDILIISNYYPPETGAAANRIETLAHGLRDKGWNVSVLCPLPNYPNGKIFDGYQGKLKHKSVEKEITVYRTWVYPSNSKNKIVRLISMLSFSISLSVFLLFTKTPKKVIIQSPPLFVAFFSVAMSRLKSKKIILNVSDLWPLAGKELNVMNENFSYRMLEKIERYNYSNADLILGQSGEICTHVNERTQTRTVLYRNYPKFHLEEKKSHEVSDKIHMVYAGLLGVAQGIVVLCRNIRLPENVVLDIYGNGAEKAELIEFIKEHPDKNIFFHGELTRTALHEVLTQKADYALIPLINRIYGSVPSKIFEMAHIGLPIIYIAGGEGGEVVTEYQLGEVITPRDYETLNQVFSKLTKTDEKYRKQIQEIARERFSFDRQMEVINEEISQL
ncbi:MAG TPA: glycosyltransferase family 4 protein [Flavobacterium sp.]|uniref:glycosyltransferase family 4 protein n=1 Tax=Flavobacterium sp. TaxID=239 RepID=UPI002C34E9EB|nr:glycosyltransferase family 4 protein [Flavobacterium sp.]HSD14539.1 glycosyltransferase family 4 protein [Flavobacterium sp.]